MSTPLRPRSRRVLRWIVPVLLIAVLALPMGFAEPRDGWSLEARVPSTALGVISIEDIGGMEARFEKTAIAGLFREPEMKAFTDPIEKAATELLESGEDGPLGESGPMILKVLEQLKGLKGQVAVAVLDVDMDAEKPVVVASLDFGKHVDDFITFVQTTRAEIDPEGKAIEEFEKDGRLWWRVIDGPPITATTVDTAFVLGTDADALASVIAGVGEDSLAANPHYQTVRRKAGGDELGVFAFANVPAIAAKAAEHADADVMRIANHLGLDTVKGAAYGMAFAGDGFMDSIVVHAPNAEHGIVPLIQMPAFQSGALPFAPANTFYFEEGAIELEGFMPRLRTLLANIDTDVVADLDEGLKHLNEQIGVDLEKELMAGLNGSFGAYATMPETGGLYPELAMLMQVKDPAAFEQIMLRTARGIAGMVSEDGGVVAAPRTLEYRGHKLHMIELQAARGRDVIPFTPTWTMIDDWCVMTLVPHAMKEIVLRRGETGGGLASQEDFVSLRRVMPSDAGSMGYLDLQAIMGLIYDTAVPLLQTAAKPNVMGKDVPFELDWAQLPAARTARPYFRSLGFYGSWTKDGMAMRMHAPLPMVGAMMLGGAGAALFFARSMDGPGSMPGRIRDVPGKRRGPAMQGSSENRLALLQAEQIGSYVRVYVLSYKELPANLDAIVEKDVAASLPKDPWGNAYVLRVKDRKAKVFQIVSAGADGVMGTKDDIATRD